MRVLVLDDSEYRFDAFREIYAKDDLTFVKNVDDAILAVHNGPWDIMSLDHNLNGHRKVEDPKSGNGFVDYLIAHNIEVDVIVVHSTNPFGAGVMYGKLKEAGYNVKSESFYQFARTEYLYDRWESDSKKSPTVIKPRINPYKKRRKNREVKSYREKRVNLMT